MEIELSEAINIVRLAKKLYDIDRYDIVRDYFYDIVCYDSYYENIINMTASIFEIYYENYSDEYEYNYMVFIDDVITDYYCMAWEYGKRHKLPDEKNPYILRAAEEARKWLNISYALEWKLLGYAKTKTAALKSRLIVYTCAYEFCEHDEMAYGLLMIYQWFSDKCAEFENIR